MMGRSQGPGPRRVASLGLTTSLTVVLLYGCGGQETSGVVNDSPSHAKEVTKNMEDFMKTQPYKNVGKEKVQVK